VVPAANPHRPVTSATEDDGTERVAAPSSLPPRAPAKDGPPCGSCLWL